MPPRRDTAPGGNKHANNLRTVLGQLKSEKVKERQEGLSSLRTVFASDEVVLHVDETGDGRAWVVVFQALFTAVLAEKETFVKKGASAAAAVVRRLSDAAAAVRWLIERSVARMNTRVIKPVLVHLLQTMVYHGKLFAPVALDYAKGIRCILNWAPHMEHILEETWVKIVELAFNVVLGDPIRRRLEEDPEDNSDDDMGSVATGMDLDDISRHDEDDEDEDTPSSSTPAGRRKRKHQSPIQKPGRSGTTASPAPRPKPMALEQIEFMSILTLLLRSPSAPLLSPDHLYLPSALFDRLARFIHLYPGDSSLHHDYLLALSAALSHVALNGRAVVSKFAREAWNGLISMWGTKNQRTKENLVVVLGVLFPFLTQGPVEDEGFHDPGYGDGVAKLWHLLNGEAENRWGVHGLSLDSLRLQMAQSDEGENTQVAFVANTFRYGWHFDSSQALAWAILELQADCTEKLYHLAESVHSIGIASSRSVGKRTKLENPVAALLDSIKTQNASHLRVYYLQILLFFIDRHWYVLHDGLQQDVLSVLLQFISFEDGAVQSWTFLCLAAIADSRSTPRQARPSFSPSLSPLFGSTTWDTIWTHAIRRINVSVVARAACHTAHVLLSHAKDLLSSHRVLSEIESLAKDLDVQGPPFPYDSVCSFLVLSLRVANQDVRLYRMQLEEKVLTWLTDTWSVARGKRLRMPLHTSGGVLALLESICSLSRRSNLPCGMLLPDCSVVDALIDHHHTAVIRDFLLRAHLPTFRRSVERGSDTPRASGVDAGSGSGHSSELGYEPSTAIDLIQPRGRERRISAFLLKSMEELPTNWESGKEAAGSMTAERVRSYLDLSVIALSFEAVLVLNGTQSNRRVTQAACRLIGSMIPLLTDKRWTAEERALIVAGLQPLVFTSDREDDFAAWETWVAPDEGTGIRQQTLECLRPEGATRNRTVSASRRQLQRLIFQSADVQDVFNNLVSALRDMLRLLAGGSFDENDKSNAMDIDDKDGFGPVRTHQDTGRSTSSQRGFSATLDRFTVGICVTSLAVIPILQLTSTEPTRDRELANFVLNCAVDRFFIVAQAYFNNVRQGTLSMSVSTLDSFLDKFGGLLESYDHAKSERLQLLTAHFLESTIDLWLQPTVASSPVGKRVRELWSWFCDMLKTKKVRSWRIRDHLTRFLDAYLTQDPTQKMWTTYATADREDDDSDVKSDDSDGGKRTKVDLSGIVIDSEALPTALLPTLGADEDIRVRWRAAVANARLFVLARRLNGDLLDLYIKVKGYLCTETNYYEQMLTRVLCLGNIMIPSSAVRRGPYWHLLETCLYTTTYTKHLEAVLTGVAERMGLDRLSQLFESYASQIAYSIRQAGKDFLQFPPRILGFHDKRQCAQAAFHAFTPTNLIAGGTPQSVEHGEKLFTSHCKAVQKSAVEGIRECFAEIIGYQIVIWMDKHSNSVANSMDGLEELLRIKTREIGESERFDAHLQQNADAVVGAILRTLRDQDFTSCGPIDIGLRDSGHHDNVTSTFRHLCRYRGADNFLPHEPNLPCYGTQTVLQSLKWFGSRVPEVETPGLTYHILHRLFAEVERTPIVNEQMRLLNGICVWIATHHSHFQDDTLLRTVVNMSAIMLAQSDLAYAAQSILEWGFSLYRSSTQRNTNISDILIRVSCLAYDYAQDSGDSSLANMGQALLVWIENQVIQLCGNEVMKLQVVKALTAWPRDLPQELQILRDEIQSSELSMILTDHRISSNKFRLVRRLRDLAAVETHGIDEEQFTQSDFWHLKECIPSTNQLLDDDIDAFAALLLLNHGHLSSFGNVDAQGVSQNLRTRHRNNSLRKDLTDGYDAARRAIVVSLLAMLDATSAVQVHAAYLTLRSLMSVYAPDAVKSRAWSGGYHGDLLYFQAHATPFARRGACDLPSLLASQESLEASGSFDEWVPHITTLLCDALTAHDLFYAPLSPILHSHRDFAEQILPVLVQTLLQIERSGTTSQGQLPLREELSRYFTSVLAYEHANFACLRSVVDITLHLRFFRPAHIRDALAHDSWLRLDYALVSQNAIKCGAYTTALLFLELAAEYNEDGCSDPAATERILFDIYSHIDEPDGFYGIKTHDLHQFLIKRLHHEKQWDKAFQFHGAAFEARMSDTQNAQGVVEALHSFGFNRLAMTSLGSIPNESEEKRDANTMMYRLGWRTETWDLPEHVEERNPGLPLYLALRAVYRERNQGTVDSIIRRTLVEEMLHLHHLGDENLTEIRQVTQNIMCLSQVRQWRSNATQFVLHSKTIEKDQWNTFTRLEGDFDFDDGEAILATRISLVRSVSQREQRGQIGDLRSPFYKNLIDLEARCLTSLSEAARHAGHSQIALNSVVRAQALEDGPSSRITQEFANVLWLMKEPKSAVQSLANLLSTSSSNLPQIDDQEKVRRAMALACLGTWTSEASLQKPSEIITRCFGPATDLLAQIDPQPLPISTADQASVYHKYAIFAERQYHAIVTSPDALRFRVYVDRKIEEIKHRKSQIQRAQVGTREHSDLVRELKKAERVLGQDQTRFKDHVDSRKSFLALAINMYSRCLASSDAFDNDSILRLCSLWLANFEESDRNLGFGVALDRVPSHKFVFLAHQLAARLSKTPSPNSTANQGYLQRLMIRMCREHPFHSLYQVFCLTAEGSVSQPSMSARRQSGRLESQAERSAAACDLFDHLRNDATTRERVRDVERVCRASLEWAKHPIKDRFLRHPPKGPLQIPDELLIRRIEHLRVPVLTANNSVDPTTRYEHCIWINHYEAIYTTAGGVNLPKITICIGSDGQKYKQLFKGEGGDDLRQDAVMEQVFDLVNVLLRNDRETRRRSLSIRDYKVIPLASQAGVLEFVQNTSPLSKWLPPAHTRYRPGDMPANDVSKQLAKKHAECNHERGPLLELFLQLRERFKPVMRHYFTETHKNPMSWFAMRLKYARSVATTSIVGHVLGLGDRHTSNILMDNVTGEVVHIDLGIAFDQGKVLPVPERVPFRLTADMVDGLGISATQGVFQRCAEETLRVLRERSEVILTVLEVFKYDPLHSWAASELKIKRVQGSSNETNAQLTGEAIRYAIGIDMASGTADEAADRALSAVSRKLDKTLSVEYTVNELIAEATDPGNLAQMYHGWGPFY